MRFENVAILVEQLSEQIREMRYFWRDHRGPVCDQRGVFRINCVDCLDRTNLVQSALAKAVLHTQLTRLAMLAPDATLPLPIRRAFQALWANNGDAISRQYAGTSALKGDYTRTGERRLAGVVRDSYNSASRYYLNRFRDAYRQAAIDTLLGRPVAEPDLQSPDSEGHGVLTEQDALEAHKRELDRQRQMIDHCRKMCISENEPLLGAWALWNVQHVQHVPARDCVLLLSKDCYYLIDYDDLRERIVRCQCVLLEDLERIEFGPQGWSTSTTSHKSTELSINRSNSIVSCEMNANRSPEPPTITNRCATVTYCLRIHYLFGLQSGYFHLLQANPSSSPGNSHQDAAEEQLKAIVQAFKLALSVRSLNVPLFEGRLERRRSKRPEVMMGDVTSGPRVRLGAGVLRQARQAGERNLRGLRSAGKQAMSQVTNRFAQFRQKFVKTPNLISYTSDELGAEDALDIEGQLTGSADERKVIKSRSNANQSADSALPEEEDDEEEEEEIEEEEEDDLDDDDLVDIEDEDDDEEVDEEEDDDYEDDDGQTSNGRRRRLRLLHSSSSTLDTSLASKCRSNTTLGTADHLQSPLERQSSSECSDHYDSFDGRLIGGPTLPLETGTFDCFEEPQSMPVTLGSVGMSDRQSHTLLESCGILTGQGWTHHPADRAASDAHMDSNSLTKVGGLHPSIEITPVDHHKMGVLATGRPLSRSTMQLTDSSRSGDSARPTIGSHAVHISGGSSGAATSGSLNASLPVEHSSASCASIACIAGAVGATRNSDSADNALDRLGCNQMLNASDEPIAELKEYTRSNLDISHASGNSFAGNNASRSVGGARMKNSQSECCIQEQPNESVASKRDLIFNPLSRIARGVQHLNLNRLNPQQLIRRNHSNQQLDDAEYERLQQRKRESRSKIIEF
jgi:hypothetical protein